MWKKSRGRAYSGKRKYAASEELVQKIGEYNQLDMEIYNTAIETFDKQLEKYKGTGA